MGQDLTLIDSLWWPASDEHAHDILPREVGPAMTAVLPYVHDFGVCVQAGGNVGVWPLALAGRFARVYTFEPEALNYKCLTRNTAGKNIIAARAALGATAGSTGLNFNPHNTGAHRLEGGGDIPVTTIDSLELPTCGLIWLDVEGYELFALEGARETIAHCRPAIVLEIGGLADLYAVPRGAEGAWLLSRGYSLAKRIGRENIFVPS
ncbi:MAG TPA: FkbM family methyltransferase [Candidatus Paceibacterota bacterium]|nr:FkbM family methyltransferase [Candidatus Paceibacterota bacterium]